MINNWFCPLSIAVPRRGDREGGGVRITRRSRIGLPTSGQKTVWATARVWKTARARTRRFEQRQGRGNGVGKENGVRKGKGVENGVGKENGVSKGKGVVWIRI